jgi:hypothetical protein
MRLRHPKDIALYVSLQSMGSEGRLNPSGASRKRWTRAGDRVVRVKIIEAGAYKPRSGLQDALCLAGWGGHADCKAESP